jgi:regulatory protein YycI of two-component signal transduction system YycFG
MIRMGKATGFTQTKISHITELRDERVTLSEEDAIVSLYRFNELNSGDKVI